MDNTDSDGVLDVTEHAREWARGTGFAARFPMARLTVEENQETATARFTEEDGVQAELSYRKAAHGWTLDGLVYC